MKGTEDNYMFFILHFTCVLKTWHGLSSCAWMIREVSSIQLPTPK